MRPTQNFELLVSHPNLTFITACQNGEQEKENWLECSRNVQSLMQVKKPNQVKGISWMFWSWKNTDPSNSRQNVQAAGCLQGNANLQRKRLCYRGTCCWLVLIFCHSNNMQIQCSHALCILLHVVRIKTTSKIRPLCMAQIVVLFLRFHWTYIHAYWY